MPQPFAIQSATGCDAADEWVRLGVELHTKGQVVDAADKYSQALRIDPRHVVATLNLAIAYAQTPGRINDAMLAIERARILDAKSFTVLTAQCLIELEAGHIHNALEAGIFADSVAPKTAQGNHARYALALCWPTAGNPEMAIPLYEEILKHEPQHGGSLNLCFVETLLPLTTAEIMPSRKLWYERNRYTGEKQPHANDRSINRRIRVGYVSGDFKSHSAAFIFSGVLLHHRSSTLLGPDRDSIVPYFYSTLPVDPKVDDRTKAFMDKTGDRWRDISTLDDEKADALIRQDKIDILVDLSGHTGGSRLTLFTRKPAPIQVTAWGFAHGTGVPEIDYFLADTTVVPTEERQYYAEEVIPLQCVVTFEPPTWYNTRASSPAPYKRNGYITFGSYTRYEKISDDYLRACKRILLEVPDSRLEFKDQAFTRPYSIQRVMDIMQPQISAERLLFSIGTKHVDHMRTYQQADLCLDPFPHGGGVVAIEQLYMGVPLLTLYGTQPAGRTATSILRLMGREDFIAYSVDEYVGKAVTLANDSKYLAEQRKVLRKDLLDSPVIEGYVEDVEEAYRQMWKRWCNSGSQGS